MFCTSTSLLSEVCKQCPIWPFFFFFYSSLISLFPGMLLRYCLSGFDMVPVAAGNDQQLLPDKMRERLHNNNTYNLIFL